MALRGETLRITWLIPAVFVISAIWGAFAGANIGPFSLSAFLSVLCLATTLVCSIGSGLRAPRVAFFLWCLVSLVVGIPQIVAFSNGTQLSEVMIQQAVVIFSAGFALVFASQQRACKLRDSLRLFDRMCATSSLLLWITFILSQSVLEGLASSRILGLAGLVPLAWWTARWHDKKKFRFAAVLMAVLIVLTLSRTAAFIAFLLVGIAMARQSKGFIKGFLGAALPIAVIFTLFNAWQPLRQRNLSGDGSLSVFGQSINGSGRKLLWTEAISGFKSQPFLGHGTGSSRSLANELRTGMGHVHQDYLRLLYEGGVVTFAIWVLVLLIALKICSSPRLPFLGWQSDFLAFAKGMTITLVVSSMTDNSLVYGFILVPFGASVGMAIRVSVGATNSGRIPIGTQEPSSFTVRHSTFFGLR